MGPIGQYEQKCAGRTQAHQHPAGIVTVTTRENRAYLSIPGVSYSEVICVCSVSVTYRTSRGRHPVLYPSSRETPELETLTWGFLSIDDTAGAEYEGNRDYREAGEWGKQRTKIETESDGSRRITANAPKV